MASIDDLLAEMRALVREQADMCDTPVTLVGKNSKLLWQLMYRADRMAELFEKIDEQCIKYGCEAHPEVQS